MQGKNYCFFVYFRLIIKIPWFNLWTAPTTIEIDGLHLLLVPSTSVQYDEDKERTIQFEAKQKRLQKAEEARQLELHSENDKGQEEASEGWIQRLLANIIKNLEVTITRVHIRFEDKQTNSNGYPFATGVTLDKVQMKTINLNANSSGTFSQKKSHSTLRAKRATFTF